MIEEMKGKILELNDGIEYYVLDELDYNNKKYVFTSPYNQKNETIDEENFLVVEIKINKDKLIVNDINDSNEALNISNMFLAKMAANSNE